MSATLKTAHPAIGSTAYLTTEKPVSGGGGWRRGDALLTEAGEEIITETGDVIIHEDTES